MVCWTDVLMRVGRLDEASSLLERLLVQTAGGTDRRLEGITRADLGMLYVEQGRMDAATPCLEAALAIFTGEGRRLGQGSVVLMLGSLHDMQGVAAASRSCLESALASYREVGNKPGTGDVLASLAILNRHQGRLDDARLLFDQALAICHEVDNQHHAGHVMCSLSALDLLQGRLDQVADHIDEAERVNRARGYRLQEGVALSMRERIASPAAAGRRSAAGAAPRRGEALLRAIDNPFELANLLCIVVRAELAGADPAAARAASTEAEAIVRQIGATPGSGLMRGIALVRALGL